MVLLGTNLRQPRSSKESHFFIALPESSCFPRAENPRESSLGSRERFHGKLRSALGFGRDICAPREIAGMPLQCLRVKVISLRGEFCREQITCRS